MKEGWVQILLGPGRHVTWAAGMEASKKGMLDWVSLDAWGKLPVEFQSLSKLQLLYVYRNKLTGRIPPQYGNLSSLIRFAVDENNLQGDIPNDFVSIDLQSNQFEGSLSLPPNMSGSDTFPRLEFLSVAHNRFIGHIPLWLSYALNIEVIELSDNYFTGQVPNFGSLKHLRILSFYENEHLGSGKSRDLRFLAPLTNCTDLQYLDFGGCKFGGDLPPYIANISNLNTFNIEDNYISGKIPTEIGQLINLERLVLMDNQLSGTIPNTIGKLPKLFLLILERNKLLGEIPSSLGNVTMLSVLTISSNNLQGVIPSSLANCKFLLHIDLYANNLNGFIPKGLFSSNGGLFLASGVEALAPEVRDVIELAYDYHNLHQHGYVRRVQGLKSKARKFPGSLFVA
nr:probable LRR receptor-like serine/threonine-protein kinase At3g47570 [Ipomoea batatas]